MRGSSLISLGAAATVILSTGAAALAQSQSQSSPACQQLLTRLTALDRGNDDPARAEQIQRAQDAVNRQQYAVDQRVAQSRRLGCESSGFFSIFSNRPRQCDALSLQIDRQRDELDHLQNQLEQLNGGTAERAAQRQSLLMALADNGCGPQYRAAALAGQQGGLFGRLFGSNSADDVGPGPVVPLGNTYRTVCVRLDDGYYFPIEFETTPDHFQEDAQACQQQCPAANVQLYVYHNPGQDMTQAVSLNGHLYTELPSAFAYRKKLNPADSCRRPGESWYEALTGNGTDQTLQPGGVIITEQNTKQLPTARTKTQAKTTETRAKTQATMPPGSEPALAEAPGRIDPTKRKVRMVGPRFYPQQH